MTTCRRRRIAFLIALGSTCLMVLSGQIATRVGSSPPRTIPPDIAAECEGDNPYLAVACHAPRTSVADQAGKRAPAIIAFRDTPNDEPPHLLASQGEVGAVYGLAFNWHEPAVYAAAYHRRQTAFGPGGPGAIYRIDLVTRAVAVWVTVPDAGPDRHDARITDADRSGKAWAGRTSLADLDVSDNGRDLFVVNLNDRRIYRYAIATGTLIGSFGHGAAAEAWAAEARLFGLAVEDGIVYHGVIRSGEVSKRRSDLHGYVYASRFDGTAMTMVASFGLDYPRGFVRSPGLPEVRLAWLPWSDDPINIVDDTYVSAHPMPILSDLGFDRRGDMVLGLRDRYLDMAALSAYAGDSAGVGGGDLLRGTSVEYHWNVDAMPEHYVDSSTTSDESTSGAIASIPGLDLVASTGISEDQVTWAGQESSASWYAAETGNRLRRESICGISPEPQLAHLRRASQWQVLGDLAGLGWGRTAFADDGEVGAGAKTGDIEVLCAVPEAPTPTGSATPEPTGTFTATSSPSATPSPTGTTTPTRSDTPTRIPTTTLTPPPTATAPPAPSYLPLALRERCVPGKQRVDLALVIDASTTMRDDRTSTGRTKLEAAVEAARALVDTLALPLDQAAVVTFSSDATLLVGLTGRRSEIGAALDRIAVGRQTRIDRGIAVAHEELTGPRRRAGSAAVMVVLTDGLANPEPVSTAVARAREAKVDGITVFTIGLGRDADLDVGALEQMASRREYCYRAPDGEDLLAIYAAIAVEIPCPAEGYWGQK
jgi:Mg-chelatase subunit ChlD